MSEYRIVRAGPGFTVVEPHPDDDAFARWRPVLDRLSPDDRANLELAIALQPSRRAKDRIVAEAARRMEQAYVEG